MVRAVGSAGARSPGEHVGEDLSGDRMDDLAGRVAIVTGGAKGIGRACVRSFLDAGAKLVAIADVDAAAAEACARELDPGGRRTLPVAADVADRTQVRAMVQSTAARGGGLDILVNCAGLAGRQGPMESQ